ncbi:glycosyltransferase [Rhodoplanes roseus]|uniref:Group 1 glycosyl transferase n=1 Tax=Rhodoplanes roseus TaxID=29409 RepID=A0A327KTZ1_9BRAD|nr:glycosyltransferase [Rhodoplanes roseus]RAI42390.1 group 1 glycosyl transferase [Rhodoplanes roseus]
MHYVRRALRRPARAFRRNLLPRLFWPTRPPDIDTVRSVRVVGLLSSASGIGQSARLCIETVERAGYAVSRSNVAGLFDSDDHLPVPAGTAGVRVPDLSIYHLNPPMLLLGMIGSGLRPYYRSYNIGYWAWELEALPREWIAALPFVHAVLVPSRFCQEAIGRYTDKPVLVVPHPVVAAPPGSRADRSDAGRRFRVVQIFNFGSSFERKNPVALVRAFRSAFGDDPTAELILKSSRGDRHPQDKGCLLAEIGDAPNISLIDETWEARRVDDLLRSADVYASLHRSEGFGLPLAEAMMAEVPVLATDWSGNVDFCRPETSFPVECSLVEFGDGHPDYEQVHDARWAEPSVRHAAAQLRRIREDPVAARNMAVSAKAMLGSHLERHSYELAIAMLQRGRARPAREEGGRG